MNAAVLPVDEHDRLVKLLHASQYGELEAQARALTGEYPQDGRVWQLLGVSLLARGDHHDALSPLRRASELLPGNAAVWDNLGLTHFKCGDLAAADTCFRRSTQLQPDRLTAWINWSASACAAGEAERAEHYGRQALKLNPRLADAWLNLGNALVDQGEFGAAEEAYRQVLALRPGWGQGLLSLGALFEASGRLREAAGCFEDILSREAGNWQAATNLGRVYSEMGEANRAVACYRQAVVLQPGAIEARSGLLYHLLHDDTADPGEVFAEHRAFGDLVEAPYRATWGRHDNDRDPARRLRIGFVSGDLRDHAVAFFIVPLLEGLDGEKSALYVYHNCPSEDAVSARLQRLTTRWWRVAGMSDEQLAARIREDQIDILVDLSGHTAYHRLTVFARKPAPVQVSWLGYPGTTGLQAMDYRPIYRGSANPGELDDQFTEKLVYLSSGGAFQPPELAPPVNALPALQNGYVTFGSLNRPGKLGERLLAAWAEILRRVPGSRLLVGAVGDPALPTRLQAYFTSRDIEPDRLEFQPRLPMEDYLALHHRIDMLLDSFPYGGGTTSQHAVWMGLPVVTLSGLTLQQRAGRGIMHRAGLRDWVAESVDEYVGKAVAAANDLDRLATVRMGMRERLSGSPQWQHDLYARAMERAFREMWRRWCAGLPPASFELSP